MTPLAQAITEALVQFVWQGFLVSLLVAAAAFLLRKQSPNVRYLLYCVALLSLAALPIVTAIELYDPLSPGKPGPAAITLTIRAVWNGSVPPVARIMAQFLAISQPWVLRIWLLGVAFLSLRLAWLGARVASLRHAGWPAADPIFSSAAALAQRMGMTRTLRVLISAIPDGPSVVGWFRPAILLPAATLLNLTPGQLEAILAHELAHLRRYDDVINIVQSVIETLLFYHPAVWWMSARVRHERELCCDDLAVRTSGDALCYARALTALETLRGAPVGLALGAATSPLEYRIRRVVGQSGESTRNYLPSSLPGMLAIGLALTLVAFYSTPANGSAPAPPAPVIYPESARVNGIQGTVPVEVRVDDQGNVSHAKAIGGPRELRQAAVNSASTQHFAPDDSATPKQVNVVFQLDRPVPSAPPAVTTVALSPTPAHTGPSWLDEGESNLGLAAANEKDPVERLQLLKQWEQLYPVSDFKAQRAVMMARALLAVLSTAYGKTDPAVLDAAKKAAQELADHFNEYLDDSVKPATLTPEEWADTRKTSELQIHTVLAWIAQANRDDDTAEVELQIIVSIDPAQATACSQLGQTMLREIVRTGDVSRYPEAMDYLTRSLAITGPFALTSDSRLAAESTINGAPEAVFGAAVMNATVVSQPSANQIVVNLGNAPDGNAILLFDAAKIGAVRPGSTLQFRGVLDSYTANPPNLTFVIRNPKSDMVWLNHGKPKRGGILARVFKGLFHFVEYLA
jgi:beta-lactamase regulating signal transducer with metallopeptidase domain